MLLVGRVRTADELERDVHAALGEHAHRSDGVLLSLARRAATHQREPERHAVAGLSTGPRRHVDGVVHDVHASGVGPVPHDPSHGLRVHDHLRRQVAHEPLRCAAREIEAQPVVLPAELVHVPDVRHAEPSRGQRRGRDCQRVRDDRVGPAPREQSRQRPGAGHRPRNAAGAVRGRAPATGAHPQRIPGDEDLRAGLAQEDDERTGSRHGDVDLLPTVHERADTLDQCELGPAGCGAVRDPGDPHATGPNPVVRGALAHAAATAPASSQSTVLGNT